MIETTKYTRLTMLKNSQDTIAMLCSNIDMTRSFVATISTCANINTSKAQLKKLRI